MYSCYKDIFANTGKSFCDFFYIVCLFIVSGISAGENHCLCHIWGDNICLFAQTGKILCIIAVKPRIKLAVVCHSGINKHNSIFFFEAVDKITHRTNKLIRTDIAYIDSIEFNTEALPVTRDALKLIVQGMKGVIFKLPRMCGKDRGG